MGTAPGCTHNSQAHLEAPHCYQAAVLYRVDYANRSRFELRPFDNWAGGDFLKLISSQITC